MAYIHGEKELADLLQHPAVEPHINYGIFRGVSGGALVDYALHVVNTAVNAHPEAIDLRDKYEHIKTLNPSRFGLQVEVDYSQPKNPSYSARRCTEPINPLA